MTIWGSGDATRPQALFVARLGLCLTWRQIAAAAPASVLLGSSVAAGDSIVSFPISPVEA